MADQELGRERVGALLHSLGADRESLGDANAWVSVEFVSRLISAISEAGATSDWLARAMRRGMSARYLGILYPLFRALGTPAFVYRRLPQFAARVNKVTRWEIEEVGDCHVRLSARADAAQQQAWMCPAFIPQLASVTSLFDLPPAIIEHPVCANEGADCCIYEVRWQEHQRPLGALFGFASGLLTSGAVVASGLARGWVGWVLPVLIATTFWALGWIYDSRRVLRRRVEDLAEVYSALSESTQDHEKRFAELLEAKAQVDRKVAEATQQLAESLEQVQAKERAKTDFFNNVSHELRSPLTMILAPLEDLAAGREPAGGRQTALESMKRNAARLLHLINQLLDLATVDAGQARLAPVPTDMRSLVHHVVGGFDAASQGKGAKIEVTAPECVQEVVLDRRWIESAVGNLLANALKFTEVGGRVRVAIVERADGLSVSVSDDGPGIAPEDQEKIFERFAQTDGSAKLVGGTGIGLALVREAVTLHGGTVELESAPGEGATFTLLLPRAVPPNSRELPARAQPSVPVLELGQVLVEAQPLDDAVEHPGPGPEAPLSLVVEDDPELRALLVATMGARYRVCAAADGQAGLQLAQQLDPDVVVTDVAMPGTSGMQLCRALRSSEKTRSTPILMVTARIDQASVLEGFEAGANDYILKPFHGSELLARVDVHVQLRRLMKEFALRERHAMLGVIAASVAHQVRNPLTTLVSGLPAMRARLGSKLDGPSVEMMDVMIDCSRRIEELTVDLLDISRIDRAEGGAYDPCGGLRAAIRLVEARLPSEVELEYEIAEGAVLCGRQGDMNQVFLNLLDNAARAVGGSGRIRVTSKVADGHYTVCVGDSGKGIDEASTPRIFDAFFTTRPAGEGTGLGLAIALQVVQRHGGRIEVGRSALGGAEFRVRIPLADPTSEWPASGASSQGGLNPSW